ncbi:helix-turn-helix domain-containing protein [Cellulomonas shaoxiangyii]|nr:helix-turn-helix transcriptional regulator [Cellulomonas shaoxiangyii]
MTTIGDRVREARLAAGLSQTALAGNAFSPSYISLIEAGHREPTDAALTVLAERLGTTLEFLKHGDDGPNEARTRLELDYARLDLASGDAPGAVHRISGLDLSVITPALRSEALTTLARAHEMTGDLEAAITILEPLLAETQGRNDQLRAAVLTTALVGCYLEAGDLHRAVEVGERTLGDLDRADLVGTDEHLRLASTVLWAYVERGDLLYATHRAAELVRLAESLGTPRGRGSVYWNAALVAEQRRDYELAQRYTERALALLSEGEPDRDLPRLRVNYAWLLLRSEPADPKAALDQIDLAEPGLSAAGSKLDVARLQVERSRAHLLLGDVDEAEADAHAALTALGEAPRLEAATAHLALGDVLAARGDQDGAAAAYRWGADMLGMMAATRHSAGVWRELGDRYLRRGEVDEAARAYDRALREAGFQPSLPTGTPHQTWSLG